MQIGLFVFDADANVRRDINSFSDRFADRCWIVIDDYLGGADKSGKLRTQVDELVSAGRLEPLGFYGFGTWDRSLVYSTHCDISSIVSPRLVHVINT